MPSDEGGLASSPGVATGRTEGLLGLATRKPLVTVAGAVSVAGRDVRLKTDTEWLQKGGPTGCHGGRNPRRLGRRFFKDAKRQRAGTHRESQGQLKCRRGRSVVARVE